MIQKKSFNKSIQIINNDSLIISNDSSQKNENTD